MISTVESFQSSSVEETIELAENFARALKPGDAIGLIGELGSGKTHFVKGMARAFGIEEHVKSPSFVIVNVYDGARLPDGDGTEIEFFHIDLYRVGGDGELAGLGLEEYICSPGVSVIEWADKAGELTREMRYMINFTVEGGDKRRIDIERREGL